MNMNISSSVRDCWGLFTHEAVMSALLRDISSSSSSSTTTEQSLTSAATQSFTCLLLNDLHSPITIDDVRKQAQSIRDTHVDRSCKRSCSDLEQTKHNSMSLDTLDLSKPSNNTGVVYGEVTEVKCLESDCFDCQINAPTKARASMLDFIQRLEKSITNDKHQLDHALGSNGMIKLVQNLKDTKITSLNLQNDWIDSNSLINLVQYLPSTQIKALDLSENYIGRIGFEYLSKVLRETQISSLNVSKNRPFDVHTLATFFGDESSMNKKCEEPFLCCSVCHVAEIFENSATRFYLDLSFSVNENLNCLASILKNSNIELINLSSSEINRGTFGLFAANLVDSSVTTLNMSGCKIGNKGVEILASVLENTNILSLNLSDNNMNCDGLEVLATCLTKSQITSLNLSSNRFNIDGMNSLATVLPNTKITSLSLNFCGLGNRSRKILSECLARTKITSLGFVDNVPNNAVDIESLAIEVKKSLISSINLGYETNNSNNNGDTIVKLLSFCMVGSQLTSISLSYCSIDCYRMQNLVIALKNSSITSVKLIATSMTSEVMKIFVSCLINSKITNLQLSNSAELDVGALKCLALALRNTQISSLNLSCNQLDCQSLKVLAPCLEDSKLTYLDLAYNGIDYENEIRKIERSDVGVKCLAMALKKSEITSLNLADNGLSCKSLMSIVLSLPYTKVTTLNLNGNDICCNVFYLADIIKSTQINHLDVGMMAAREALSILYDRHSKTKTHLNLSYFMRCSFSLYYLSHVDLLHTKNITHLELKQNQISCCGELKDICECISGSHIVSLDLSENKINSVYHLAELLQHSSISTLNLSYNQISSDGIKHLSRRLPRSKVISLDLSYNLITDESIEYLSDSLVNTKITDLNLSGNQIGRQAVENLSERVAHIIVQFQLQSDDPQNHFYLCKYPDCIIEVYRTSSEVNIHHLIDYVGNKIEMTKVFIRSKKVNDHVGSNLANMTHFSNINISEIEMVQHSSFPYFIFRNISQLKLNGTRTENAPGGNGEKIIELRLQNIQNPKFKDLQKLRFSNIMYLDLSNNNMEDDQLECLAAALKSNSMNQSNKNYLMSLNLSNNKLEARSAELLAEVLQYIPTLTYIDLHGNKIGYAGFQSLMKVVDKTNLCWLSLEDNNIEDQLEGNIELSPYIVPRKCDEMPVAFQLRYLFRQLVSLNTCSGELEFTIPTTVSNPPVNITHYPKLLKIYSEFENDVDYLNVNVYDIYYMKSKKHDMWLLQRIEKFVHEIEKRFLSFIDSNLMKLEQAFGYDSFVALVKECDRLGLTKCVEFLLLHRVCYYVDDAREILHPFIYRMLHEYSMPLYCKQIEPNKREQIIAYYQTHSEIEGAHTLIDLLTSMSNEQS